MKKCSLVFQRCVGFISWVGVVGAIAAVLPIQTVAQIVPDASLGTERSVVTPNTVIRGLPSDRIDGGAIRGSNLFHSFQQFNIGEGRGAYFTNPAGIENILSRVTGNSRSEILGRLGVLGNANLFLLNPNGIVFGANASLDVAGSFTATTANAIALGDQGFFGATQPENSRLLAVAPGALFFDQQVRQPRTIQNSGTLNAGRNLTLAADNLELQGQVRSGGNLTLQAQDTLRIRDSVTAPFVASAGGNLLVQGDRSVDIFALNHPDSGLFSGGDMVLRSANQVGGDAHYWSGGNFRIEQLDGSLGALYSPYDPIILVAGNLFLNNYIGASLHILAGGFVYIPGTVEITGADTDSTSLVENVTLSDGTVLAVDGTARPTLDIRAGIDLSGVTIPGGIAIIGSGTFPGGGAFESEPSGTGIILGQINIIPPDGLVFLTNQYQPNVSLPSASIGIIGGGAPRAGSVFPANGIDARGFGGDGSSVIIDSRNNIVLFEGAKVFTGSDVGRGGNIQLIAGGSIALDRLSGIEAYSGPVVDITSSVNPINNNRGGDISLSAGRNIVLEGGNSLLTAANLLTNGGGKIQTQSNQLLMGNFSGITSATVGTQGEGNITIRATDAVRVNGGNIGTFTFPGASARGGNIVIETGELTLIGAAAPDSFQPGGRSTGGDITSDTVGSGSAGIISIDARQLKVLDGAQIRANTSTAFGAGGTGNAGNITISASDSVEVSGSLGNDLSKIAASVNPGATGQGGNVSIETNRLTIRDEAQIQAGAFGAGQGGSVTIKAPQSIEIVSTTDGGNATGILTGPEDSQASGNGGTLDITTSQLTLRGDGAQISNEVDTLATGNAGSTTINVDRLTIAEGGRIRAGTFYIGQNGSSQGRGGSLQVTATDSIDLSGTTGAGEGEEPSGILLGTFGLADAGELTLTTRRLTISNGASITASTLGLNQDNQTGVGRGGNIIIDATDSIEVSGRSTSGEFDSNIASESGSLYGLSLRSSRSSTSPGGTIRITTGQLTVQDGADVSTQTISRGNAGNLVINATGIVQLLDGDLRTRTEGVGNAGNLTITAGQLTTRDGEATAATERGGRGGNVLVTVSGTTELIGSGGLAALSIGGDDAGDLTLKTNQLIVRDGAGITTESIGRGRAGNLTITAPTSIEVIGGAFRTGEEANRSISDLVSNPSPFEPNQTYFFPSRISAAVGSILPDTPAADLTIQAGRLTVRNGGEISTQTLGNSPGGKLSITASEINVDGTSAALRSDVDVTPSTLSATALDTGNAGSIFLNVRGLLQVNDGTISTSAAQSSGGAIDIAARDIRLRGNSDITTFVDSGAGGGGNISLTAKSIIALGDSDILSFARDGQGGNITLNTRAFFGQNYRPAPTGTDPRTLDGNNRVDVNASGTVSGIITIPDTTFIQNSLTQLSQNLIDPNTLLANSCIVRNRDRTSNGTFLVTGSGGLPTRPGDPPPASFPTGGVRSLPEPQTSRTWQPGDPIVEPQGIYRLASGKLVMSRECAP